MLEFNFINVFNFLGLRFWSFLDYVVIDLSKLWILFSLCCVFVFFLLVGVLSNKLCSRFMVGFILCFFCFLNILLVNV